MTSITEYVKDQGITAEARFVESTQERSGRDYARFTYTVNRYRVTLHKDDESTPEFDWSQGEGITDSPEDRPDSILDALVSDATGYENASDVWDFAEEFGYEIDSADKGRDIERTYKACGETAEFLRTFLGDDYELVAYELERL